MLYRVVLSFVSVDAILKCEYSSKRYGAVISRRALIYTHTHTHQKKQWF